MKKILFAIALVFTLSVANAQTDGFFGWNGNNEDMDRSLASGVDFNLPETHGTGNDYNSTPIGSGLLVLTALGAGYAVKCRRKK